MNGVLTIGMRIDLTGALTFTGRDMQRATQLAMREVDETGDLGGQTLRLTFGDTQIGKRAHGCPGGAWRIFPILVAARRS